MAAPTGLTARAMPSPTPASQEDGEALALARVCEHHDRLARRLDLLVDALITAVVDDDRVRMEIARSEIVNYLLRELLPHADAEEDSVYPAARTIPWAMAITDELAHEHVVLNQLTQRLEDERHPVRSATTAESLRVMFRHHVTSENTVVLPLVAATPGLSLASLVSALHELTGH